MSNLDPNSLGYLMLTHIGPPTVTVILGALFASLLIPRWQKRWNHNREIEARRVAMYETISESFSQYVTAWRRLLQIASLERDRPLSEREMDRKEEIVRSRTEARDRLVSEFAKARLYFSEDSSDAITRFCCWDEQCGSQSFGELPDFEEWRRWEDLIIQNLRQDITLQ